MHTDLPPIHTWWPELPIDGKHLLLANLDAQLPPPLIAAISEITGKDVGQGARLTDDDRAYIETQSEQVD